MFWEVRREAVRAGGDLFVMSWEDWLFEGHAVFVIFWLAADAEGISWESHICVDKHCWIG